MRLIDADALKDGLFIKFGNRLPNGLIGEINNAPTVELTETEIQEVLNKRCMTAVINEYLIALHGKRLKGKWELHGKRYYCSECGEEAINLESEPDVYSSSYCLTNYCPNCGAEMRGKENG